MNDARKEADLGRHVYGLGAIGLGVIGLTRGEFTSVCAARISEVNQ